MSKEERITLSDTEAEAEAAGRLALRAAMKELDGIVWHEERESSDAVMQILKAMRAIKQELRKYDEDFRARNPGKKFSPFGFISGKEILASAYWACGNDVDEADVHPSSRAGNAILDFAAAIALINSVSNAVSEITMILDDGSDGLTCGVGSAEIILDYVTRNKP